MCVRRPKLNRRLARLDPDALTIGFARRFATYKRGNLIFRHIERLKALFSDSQQPLQILFAGKAHPSRRRWQGADPPNRSPRAASTL